MTSRIVQIGKHQWLAGMSWRSFEDSPSKELLNQDKEKLGVSWVCVRLGESAIQAGYCAAIDEIKRPKKLFSLAAMLADSREQPWLGIFKIAEGLWWYVAVRDGHAILPDGDIVGDENEIFAARERHSGFSDWKYVEGDVQYLEGLIASIDAKPSRIRSLERSPLLSPVAICVSATIVSSVFAAGWWLNKTRNEEENQAAMVRMKAHLQAKPAVVAPSPLKTLSMPNEWLASCYAVLSDLNLSEYGWALGDVACEGSTAAVKWLRADGATVAHMPPGILSESGDLVMQVHELKTDLTSIKENAIQMSMAKLALSSWSQAANFTLTFSTAPEPKLLPGEKFTKEVSATGGLKAISVKIFTKISPFHLDLSAIPGLRLSAARPTENGWLIEGELYGF